MSEDIKLTDQLRKIADQMDAYDKKSEQIQEDILQVRLENSAHTRAFFSIIDVPEKCKYTKELVKQGLDRDTICNATGISKASFYNYIK